VKIFIAKQMKLKKNTSFFWINSSNIARIKIQIGKLRFNIFTTPTGAHVEQCFQY